MSRTFPAHHAFEVSTSVVVAALLGACGGNSTSDASAGPHVDASCSVQQQMQIGSGAPLEFRFCFEALGLSSAQIDQLEQTCSNTIGLADAGLTQTSTFSRAACSRTGVIAGCTLTASGLSETIWYYADSTGGVTSDLLEQTCAQSGGTFVPPPDSPDGGAVADAGAPD